MTVVTISTSANMPGFKRPSALSHLDANFQRARVGFDLIADAHDLAVEFFVGIREHGEGRILADFDRRDVALLDLGDHPQIRRIADRVDLRFLVDEFADGALALGDDAVNRRFEFERLAEQFRSLHKRRARRPLSRGSLRSKLSLMSRPSSVLATFAVLFRFSLTRPAALSVISRSPR